MLSILYSQLLGDIYYIEYTHKYISEHTDSIFNICYITSNVRWYELILIVFQL